MKSVPQVQVQRAVCVKGLFLMHAYISAQQPSVSSTSANAKPRATSCQLCPPSKHEEPLQQPRFADSIQSPDTSQKASPKPVEIPLNRTKARPVRQAPKRGASEASSPLSDASSESEETLEDDPLPHQSDIAADAKFVL